MSKSPRLILCIILIPIVLLVVTALVLPLLLDKNTILELAAGTLHEKTGATLTVEGRASLSFFPTLGVTLGDAGLAMPGEDQPSLRVRSLTIGVQLLPLLSGRAEIDSIALEGLALRIEPGKQAPRTDTSEMTEQELDVFYARRRQAAEEEGQNAGAALALPLALNVERLTINDSRIEQVDNAGQTSTLVELVELEANGLNLESRPIKLAARLTLPRENPLTLTVAGTVRVDQEEQIATLDKVIAVIAGATAQPLRLQTRGEVDLAGQVADLALSLSSGETRGEGSLRYARFESPQIDTRLKLNLLNPALLALAGPEAAARSGGDTATSNGDQPLPLDAIRAIDTRAELAIDQATFDAHTISELQTNLRIVDGVIQISSLTGVLHGGQLQAQAVFNGKHNTATFDTSGQLAQLDIAAALAATGAKPVLTGSASLEWQLASKGRTSKELLASLNGPIKLATSRVVLQDTSVEHMLCQAVALTNQEQLTATFPTSTAFKTLGADIQLSDGKARLAPLRAELPQVTLKGTGNLDLLSKDFKATFKARLSPELETLDRACRVSKRLTDIDWPVDCKGNANDDPAKWCSVDTAEIIEDLGKNEAKRKLQKEAGKLLDKLFR